MAFDTKSPLALFQASLSKDAADSLMAVKFREILQIEETSGSLFSYHMASEKMQFLIERGVYLSPNSVSPHSHPLCKTLENHFLYKLLPMYVDKSKSIVFFSCKQSKVKRFSDSNEINVVLVNRIIEAKDASRYAGTHLLKKNDPLTPVLRTYKQAFFHDEIHHWSYEKFRKMLSDFKGKEMSIYATAVYPVECLSGFRESMNPLCYQYEVHNDKIYFFPDGNREGMYVQSRETWLFGTSHIYDHQGRVWTVTKLNSIAAHHLFMITLGDFESPDRYMYNDYTLVPMNRFNSKIHYPLSRVRAEVIKNVIIYLMALKKPDVNSAVAKVRQICGKEISQDEAIFAASLAKNISNCSFVASLGDKFGLEAMFDTLYSCCPPFAQRFFDRKKFFSREFIKDFSNMEPLSLTLKRTRQLHKFYDPNYSYILESNMLYQGDLATLIEQTFWYGSVVDMDRTPAPYDLNYMFHNFDREKVNYKKIWAYLEQRSAIKKAKRLNNLNILKGRIYRLRGPVWWEEKMAARIEVGSASPAKDTDEETLNTPLGDFLRDKDSEIQNFLMDLEKLRVIRNERQNLLKQKEEIGVNNQEKPEEILSKDETKETAYLVSCVKRAEGENEPEAVANPEEEEFGNNQTSIKTGCIKVKWGNETDTEENYQSDPESVQAGGPEKAQEGCRESPEQKREQPDTDYSISMRVCPHEHEEEEVPGDGNCFYHTMARIEGSDLSMADYKREKLEELLEASIIDEADYGMYMQNGFWADEKVTKPILARSLIEVRVHQDLGNSCYIIGRQDRTERRCMFNDSKHFKPLVCGEIKDDLSEEEVVLEKPHKFDMKKVSAVINRGLQNACIIKALSKTMKVDINTLLICLVSKDPYWGEWVLKEEGGTVGDVLKAMKDLGQSGNVHTKDGILNHDAKTARKRIHLFMFNGHCSSEPPIDYKVPNFGRRHNEIADMISALPMCSKVTVTMELARANKIRESLLNSYTGVDSSSFKRDIIIRKQDGVINREVMTFLGFAGSGKSRGLMNLVSGTLNRKDVIVIVPRVHLRQHWVESVKDVSEAQRFKCLTFETALKNLRGKETIIIDEITLFPPGYLDLVEYISDCKNLVILGDPLQRVYHNKSDRMYLNQKGDIEKFCDLKFKYALYSHRLPEESSFDIVTKGRRELHPCHGKIFKEKAAMYKALKGCKGGYHILSMSKDMANSLTEYCAEGNSMTIGESQGLTFNFAVIVVDTDAKLADSRTWMVALTRSLGGHCFLMLDSITDKIVSDSLKGSFLHKAMQGVKISKDHLINSCGRILKNAIIIEDEGKFCGFSDDVEEKLSGDPYLKGMINILEFPFPEEDEILEPARHDSPPKTHILLSPEITYLEISEKMKARESREFRSGLLGWSSQFNDLDNKPKPGRLNPWCSLYQAIYPKHEGMDDLTFWAAVRKRLLFSTMVANSRALEETRLEGSILFDKLVETYGLRGRAVNIVMEETMDEFRSKRLLKSKALIERHSNRSEPDWDPSHFKLFMKTQLCSKFEKRFNDAKAGQTLACFAHSVLFRFGERCRQFEKDFRADLGPNIYIHSQRNFDELNDFVKERFNSIEGTDSDFEAFDRSQDATILNLELKLLAFYGWPRDLIEDYKLLKLSMGCKLGSMAVMRFTGEFGTFIFNTIANMAFTAVRYELKKDTVLLFAGDDMCSPGKLKVSPKYSRLLDKLNLKAKVNFSREPMFCGWRLSPFGIYKEPRLILERWLIAEEKGTLSDCFVNYSLEAIYAYELGDKLYDLIEDLEPYQELVRKIVKIKHNLPFRVRHHFESHGDDLGECREVHKEGGGWEHDNGGCGSLCHI